MHRNLENISIILVEPQGAGNIGMVCRAMKNMGINKLRLVNPCDTTHLDARRFALSAIDILENAARFETLSKALEDVSLSFATTRRIGKYRQDIHTPVETAQKILSSDEKSKCAIVFGREDSGLTTGELSLCSFQSSIDTSSEYGSMNLAQAVLIFCYEIRKAKEVALPRNDRTAATSRELECLFEQMESTLLKIGYLNPVNPAHIMRSFRRIVHRAEVDSREVSILRGMMSQIDWACGSFEGKK